MLAILSNLIITIMRTLHVTPDSVESFLRIHRETLRNYARCFSTERGYISVWVNDDFTIRSTRFIDKPFDRRPYRVFPTEKSLDDIMEKYPEGKIFFCEILYDGVLGGQHIKSMYYDVCESFWLN